MRIRNRRTDKTCRLIHYKVNVFFWLRTLSHKNVRALLAFLERACISFPENTTAVALNCRVAFCKLQPFFG